MAGTDKTYSGRYIKRGGSYAITVPPELRQRMGFIRGDYVLWLVIGDVVRVRRVHPGMVLAGEFEKTKPAPAEGNTK